MDLKLIYIVFFGSAFGCYAQNDSLQNSYFKSYNDKVTATIYYLDTSNNFQIGFDTDGEKNFVDLEPNRREQLGLSLSYKFVDISFGFAPKFFSENKDNSDSKLFSFNTRFYYKKWMQSFTFINQKGFYISDEDVNVFLPKMRTTKIGGTTSYIFNDKFSYKTLVNQNEWQTKSSGSFIPAFSFYYTNLNLNNEPDSSNGDIYVFSLAPSYFYNFVINDRILIGSGIAFGAGINDVDGDVSALYELDLNLKLAFNTDRFFAFASLNNINFIQNEAAEARLSDNISTVKISVGYRFDPPNKVKEVYEKVNQKTGF
ncbi:DUF4421 family protein [Flavobacterium sp. ANB]|uniref:DUF4421 family protein n=1 Tax=unclassified Flavobacterium TaxID=196869 RepID=UPI0012B7E7C4|nr:MULTISPECIES: DUF4421 family protein [unclassified Flavobacterium]MBF4517052.1 DUF4421 family protein [Flavobacterium sp. ANB]MTD71789.1 DUF4421 domain-containing protein [Flavobacterium sp. LC2016-13]